MTVTRLLPSPPPVVSGGIEVVAHDGPPAWKAEGSCRGKDPETFYAERGGDVTEAKAICEGCPVREPCLAWALAHENFGIWGGKSERERKRMRRMAKIEVHRPESGWLPGMADVDDLEESA